MKALDAIPTRREGAAALAAHRGRRVVGQPAAGGDSVDGSAAGRCRCGGNALLALGRPRQQQDVRVEGEGGDQEQAG